MTSATAVKSADISILYLGVKNGTSLDRANALRRDGYRVTHVNLLDLMPQSKWVWRITWKLGGHIFSPWILRKLPKVLNGERFDVCFVDSGEWVTPKVISLLRQHARKIVNYNIDDPLGMRDVKRFIAYRRSLPYYDLCAVVRAANVAEAKALGARDGRACLPIRGRSIARAAASERRRSGENGIQRSCSWEPGFPSAGRSY